MVKSATVQTPLAPQDDDAAAEAFRAAVTADPAGPVAVAYRCGLAHALRLMLRVGRNTASMHACARTGTG